MQSLSRELRAGESRAGRGRSARAAHEGAARGDAMMLAGTVLEVCLLLVLLVAVALLTRRRSLPLSVGLVVVGLLLSTVGASPAVGELRGETFEQVVVFLFLPALVFAAALDL
ncbi:MAG: hypothetical protein KY451_11255, partial [Actinobacteria bacterium]|nr:hypothetical protein [Actinomycetota bacterium]